jgi:hypothetical protein
VAACSPARVCRQRAMRHRGNRPAAGGGPSGAGRRPHTESALAAYVRQAAGRPAWGEAKTLRGRRGALGPRPWRPTLRRRGGSRPPSRLSPRHQGAHNSHTRTRQAPGLGSSPSWSGANAMRRGEPPQSLARGHEAEHGGEFGVPRPVPVACAHGVTEPHARASRRQTNPGRRVQAVGLYGHGLRASEPEASGSSARKGVGVRVPPSAPVV